MLIGGIALGLILGLLAGGSLVNLASVQLRRIQILALAVILRFGTEFLLNRDVPIADTLRVPLLAAAFGLLLVALWANRGYPGMSLAFIGVLFNGVVILVNGGYMPVSPAALAAMGRLPREGYSNSRLVEGVVLGPLTDLFAMPTWVPSANVFSVGDILIGVGAAMAVVAAMHGRGPRIERAAGTPVGASPH